MDFVLDLCLLFSKEQWPSGINAPPDGSNIFIFAFDPPQRPACVSLLALLLENRATHRVHIPRLVLKEIRRNLIPFLMQDAMKFAHQLAIPDENFVVPFKLGATYEARGLKSADAFIAAYTEWAEADFLISENRHFLTRQKNLPFQVLSAEQALKLLKRSS